LTATTTATAPVRLPRRPVIAVVGAAALLACALFAAWLTRAPPPQAQPASQPQVAAAAPAPPKPAGFVHGYVTINSRPWSAVYIDGALVARSTPLRRHEVSVGKHTITLQRADGVRAAFDVEVLPGETLTKLYDWDSR
jgi:hypothetical protein